MWIVCTVCGALTADFWLHARWHADHDEPAPDIPPGVTLPPDPYPDLDQPDDDGVTVDPDQEAP